MTFYLDSTKDLSDQRKTLLQAVRVLSNHGHHALARQLWDVSSSIHQRRVLLPGEPF